MFCLRRFEDCYRKGVIGGESLVKVGQHCCKPSSCSALRCVFSSPPAHSLETDWLCMHEQTAQKILVYVRGVYLLNIRGGGGIGLLPLFPLLPLSLLLSFVLQTELWIIQAAGTTQDLRTGDILCFLPLPCL